MSSERGWANRDTSQHRASLFVLHMGVHRHAGQVIVRSCLALENPARPKGGNEANVIESLGNWLIFCSLQPSEEASLSLGNSDLEMAVQITNDALARDPVLYEWISN